MNGLKKDFKYEYTCLNIYSGEYYTCKTNTFYPKGTILKGEYQFINCRLISGSYLYTY